MPRTVLLTLGRLPKALDIARSFRLHGWRVLIAEPFAWHLCRVSSAVDRSFTVTAPAVDPEAYLRDLVAIIEREAVELVVPVSEEIIHASHLGPRLPPGVRLYARPPAELLPLHSKAQFVERAAAHGVAAPETQLLGSPGAAALAARGPVVVKPVFSCSGRGVQFLSRGSPLPAADPAVPAVVQARVAGDVFTSFSIAHAGRALATVVYRGAVMSGTVAVCFERVAGHRAIEAWVDRFIDGARFDGFISFDFVVDAEGTAWGIECNPRATSGIHFVETADIAPAVIDAATAGPVRFRTARFMQQFWPSLTEWQNARGEHRRRCGHYLRTARDVTWQASDPLPLLTMPFTAWNIIQLASREGRPFGEVATRDVGWY
jgi:predicted ATP-grasp superfamily ATP-dependent carboligase